MRASRPAILGGDPILASPLKGGPCIDDTEFAGVERVLRSGVLSGFIGAPGPAFLGGPEVRCLEQEWSSMGSYQGAVAVNSATSALHTALIAMDLPPGSSVIVPPLTMSATVAAVVLAGLTPRFADVDASLFTLNASTIEGVVDRDVTAVLVVHLFGQMAPMGEIREVAEKWGIRVLEDSAQSPGATQDGQWPGHVGSGSVFSFNQNKVVTCGEGGILASNDSLVLERASLIRNHGESSVHHYPHIDPRRIVGLNYRMTEMEAAVARAQSAKLTKLNQWRVDLANQLTGRLRELPGLEPPAVLAGNRHVYFVYALRYDVGVWELPREMFVRALSAEGVPCSEGYVQPLNRLPVFDAIRGSSDVDPDRTPVANRLAEEELVLVSACQWPVTRQEIDLTTASIERCWEQRKLIVDELRKD